MSGRIRRIAAAAVAAMAVVAGMTAFSASISPAHAAVAPVSVDTAGRGTPPCKAVPSMWFRNDTIYVAMHVDCKKGEVQGAKRIGAQVVVENTANHNTKYSNFDDSTCFPPPGERIWSCIGARATIHNPGGTQKFVASWVPGGTFYEMGVAPHGGEVEVLQYTCTPSDQAKFNCVKSTRQW